MNNPLFQDTLATSRQLQPHSLGTFSQTFAVYWLFKLWNVVERTTPTMIATCGVGGSIDLIATSHSDVTCTKTFIDTLECTSGDSVFEAGTDLFKDENLQNGKGVNATFTCSGSTEAALMAQLELSEQQFQVNVIGNSPDENIVRGSGEPQMRSHQICDDELVGGTEWCSPEAGGRGYCLSFQSCNAVCFGIGCTQSCTLNVPGVKTGHDAVSCKTTSFPEIICETSGAGQSFMLQAEDATNLVEENTPFIADETCCELTDDRFYTYLVGYVRPITRADGSSALTNFDGGDYLSFGPYNFGSENNCATVEIRYSRGEEVQTDWDTMAAAKNTAKVLFRLDSPTGPLVGEFSPTIGDWESLVVGETTIVVSGQHTIYVVAHGDYNVLSLDWIEITPGNSPTLVSTSMPEPVTSVPTNTPTSSPVLVTPAPTVAAVETTSSPVMATSGPVTPAPTVAATEATVTNETTIGPTTSSSVRTPSPTSGSGIMVCVSLFSALTYLVVPLMNFY